MNARFLILVILVSFFSVSCGGRQAHPINTVWPDDERKTCEDLNAERRSNNGKILKVRAEKERRIRRNIEYVCLCFIVIPLFYLDLNDSQNIEINALKERNARLDELALRKNCPTLRK